MYVSTTLEYVLISVAINVQLRMSIFTIKVIFAQCCCVETRNVSIYLLLCSDCLVFNDQLVSSSCLVYNNILVYNKCMYPTTLVYVLMSVAINV